MDPAKDAKSVYFDGSFLDNAAGIGRDTQNFLLAAKKVFGGQVEVIYPTLNWNLQYRVNKRKPRKFFARLTKIGALFCGTPKVHIPDGSVYIQSHMSGALPVGNQIKHIVRAHDIFPLTHPEWFKRSSVKLFRNFFFDLTASCIIICDSKTTRNEIRNIRPDLLNLRVAYCPVELPKSLPCEVCETCKNDFFSEKSYFVAIGTIEPRKNYELLVDVWSQSDVRKQNKLDLVIFGRPGWKAQNIIKKINKSSSVGIKWMKNSCDYSLFRYLQNSRGLISLSHEEGFNLPVAEAHLSGIPVLLSRNTVHEEIFGKFATFVDLSNMYFFDKQLQKILDMDPKSINHHDFPSYNSTLINLAYQIY
jgi:glycosyltransferase involved in cell wall biosynthesis